MLPALSTVQWETTQQYLETMTLEVFCQAWNFFCYFLCKLLKPNFPSTRQDCLALCIFLFLKFNKQKNPPNQNKVSSKKLYIFEQFSRPSILQWSILEIMFWFWFCCFWLNTINTSGGEKQDSFWPSGWGNCPHGKALAMPLGIM